MANNQGKTYRQELLDTVEIEDAVSLDTLSTALIGGGLHIFKALREHESVKSAHDIVCCAVFD